MEASAIAQWAPNCAAGERYTPPTLRILHRFEREVFRRLERSALHPLLAREFRSKRIVAAAQRVWPSWPNHRDDVSRGRPGDPDAGACGPDRCCCLQRSRLRRILRPRELRMIRKFRLLFLPKFLRGFVCAFLPAFRAHRRLILAMRYLVRPSNPIPQT